MMRSKARSRGVNPGSEARLERRGIALLAVLLVLLALFVLCAPFLSTVSNVDASSVRMTDRASARIALDAASRHARGRLAGSHVGIDATPYYDADSELGVDNLFPPGFEDANDTSGVMWDVEAHDESAKIDLNSASPLVLGNLLGGTSALAQPLKKDGGEIVLTSFDGFSPEGFVWVGKELVGYTELDGNKLKQLVRGIAAVQPDEEGGIDPCGPRPAEEHAQGVPVIDQRLYAIPIWRIAAAGEGLRRFSTIEEVLGAEAFVLAERFPAADVQALWRTGSVYGHVSAGPTWTRSVRMRDAVEAGTASCRLTVDEPRFFNPGTTVRITDGQTTEYGIVRQVNGARVELLDPLVNDYAAFTAEIAALVRRPVNINTADLEVLRALFLNLKLRGSTDRITSGEAERLVEDVLALRPFDGHADFLERLVLPAAGLDVPKDDVFNEARAGDGGDGDAAGYIDSSDAIALYKNALNANDYELEFSTMPFTFTSRDVYGLELRASVNAASGVQRVAATRSEIHRVVPQVELMRLLTRQKDFDDAQLLARGAPGWASGPVPTRRHDSASNSPTEARAHLGPHDRAFEGATQTSSVATPFYSGAAGSAVAGWTEPAPQTLSLPSRADDIAWVQPAPARSDETDTQQGSGWRRAGRVMHFDHEARSLEGHYLPDQAYSFAPDDPMLDWVDTNGFLRPLSGSMWLQPRSLADGEMFFDVAGSIADADRVSLLVDGGDLVLRVHDGSGNHPDTVFDEVGEVRYPLAGNGPGLPLDTWSHVTFDVRGNRPDQMSLLVDGKWNNDTPGLTRLTAGIGPTDRAIVVESTEGFPDQCVLRIGDELIEATKTGSTSFSAIFSPDGANAGFGGRACRQAFDIQGDLPVNAGPQLAYASGTPVALYGYSLSLPPNGYVPNQSARLDAEIGPFSVLYATGIVSQGGEEFENQMEAVTVSLNAPNGTPVNIQLGTGFDPDTPLDAVILESADPTRPTAEAMRAFSPNGGYAMVMGPRLSFAGTGTVEGYQIGGQELVHYSGWNGNQLAIDRRGDAVVAELGFRDANDAAAGLSRAFVVFWTFRPEENDVMSSRTLVFPISAPAQGATMAAGTGFAPARPGQSQFAQYTRIGAESDQTEWVRYDTIVNGQLVRTHPDALGRAYLAARGVNPPEIPEPVIPPGGIGGGGGGTGGIGSGTQGSGGGSSPPQSPLFSSAPTPTPSSAPFVVGAQQGVSGAAWDYRWGTAEDTDLLVTRAVSSALQFRGVLGTYSHSHPAGTLVQPVFGVPDAGVQAGWPGRFDAVMFLEASSGGGATAPAWPGRVHRSVQPRMPFEVFGYDNGGGPLATIAAPSEWYFDTSQLVIPGTTNQPDTYAQGVTFVALEASPAVPVGEFGGLDFEQRSRARITKFPSGERPRIVGAAQLGGSVVGGGAVPAALVDEVAWGSSRFGGVDGTAGAQMALLTDLDGANTTFAVGQRTFRVAGGDTNVEGNLVLSDLPIDAGVLRMGDELMVYAAADAGSGTITLAPGGRGVLGTLPQPHAAGESVTFLDFVRTSILLSPLSADSAEIGVTSVDGFPDEGTLLIDDELIHYTRKRGDVLEMPRRSLEAGAKDGRGAGLFRGRFGTFPRDHAAGAPVFVFPFRYWDRWTDGADAPELSYHQVTFDEPGAYWRTAFFDVEASGSGGSRLLALMRTDANVPWDTPLLETRALRELAEGMPDGEGNPLGLSTDRLDLRFHVEYLPGAFDPVDGLSHGWKSVPRLRLVGAEFVAPSQLLRRVER